MKKFTTYSEIENLCEAMIKDFMKRKRCHSSRCVDIEAFVTDYLGITIHYESFAEPDPGRIGFLSDGNRPIWIRKNGKPRQVVFPDRTAVIEKSLQQPEQIARKRFTIAHEGAHFILNQHVPLQAPSAFHSDFDGKIIYSADMLREMMSINEAFANRAAACCLMPLFLVKHNLKKYNKGKKISVYEDYVLAQNEKLIIQKMADAMGVNYSPLFSRLRELNLFEIRPIEEYLESKFYHGGVCI